MIFLIFILNLFAATGELKCSIDPLIHLNHKLSFIPHSGNGPFDNYLSMEVQFKPMAELFKQLMLTERRQLINRGEAHVTVVTPIEYEKVLKTKISIAEINQIAQAMNIQSSPLKIICLGKADKMIEGVEESTYYLVVKSQELINIRSAIQKEFVKRKGDAKLFKPTHFYPHITLAFSKRDLHESDGVLKDEKTCWGRIF
jgi:2'-5' RNA ligase